MPALGQRAMPHTGARRQGRRLDHDRNAPKHGRMLHIADHQFETAATPPVLADDELHLWLLERPAGLAPRAMSAFAHAELGRLLGAYAGIAQPPAVGRDPHGKPFALDAQHPHFNLSHGGARIALAFARRHAVGVDVEAAGRQLAPLQLATRFFAAAETRALAAIEDADALHAAFVDLWTCKEAVLKAHGRGLAFGLDRLRFEFDHSRPRALAEIAAEAGPASEWHVARFDAGSAHAGAVAWRGDPLRVRAFHGLGTGG